MVATHPTEAIILAGGFGTRLRSKVPDLPKPLAPVAGRPFIAWVLDALAQQGFQSITLSVGYLHEMIEAAIGTRWQAMHIHYAVETEPLGTGGGIRLALAMTTAEHVFILNGDTFLNVDYAAMVQAHKINAATITMATVQVADVSRFGRLAVAGGHVTGFLAKGGTGPGLINGGTYVINRNLFDRFDLGTHFSFEKDVLEPHVATLEPYAFITTEMFIDIGVPDDFDRAQHLFAKP